MSRHVVDAHTRAQNDMHLKLLICVLLFIHKYHNNGLVFASVQNLDFS